MDLTKTTRLLLENVSLVRLASAFISISQTIQAE